MNRIPITAGKNTEYLLVYMYAARASVKNVCVVELKSHVLFSAVCGGWSGFED
jgi:hypothetical protein